MILNDGQIFFKKILHCEHRKILKVCLAIFHNYNIFHSSVVSDLPSETKGFQFESGSQVCAEVTSLQ